MVSTTGRENRDNRQPNRAGAQAANANRRKRRRRGRRTLHYMLLLLFLLAAGAVLSFTVLFKIEGVEVIGAEKYTPAEIAEASGVVMGDNLLRIDKTEIAAGLLERFPYLLTVEVRRKPPGTVEITVTQAEPVGAILQGDEVALIDREGKLLERGMLLVPETVPLVKGIDTAGVEPGGCLGELPEKPTEEETAKSAEVLERMQMFRYLLDAMEASGFKSLTNVDITDRLNMRVIYENRITLELGSEAELPYKLALVKLVLETHIGPDEVGTLNATEAYRNRIIFDPTPDSGGGETVVWEIPESAPEDGGEADEPSEPA